MAGYEGEVSVVKKVLNFLRLRKKPEEAAPIEGSAANEVIPATRLDSYLTASAMDPNKHSLRGVATRIDEAASFKPRSDE